MRELRFKPSNDIVAKILLTEDRGALKGLISAALAINPAEIAEITLLNSEKVPAEPLGKTCRLDLEVRVDSHLISLEIQVLPEEAYTSRALYYWAMLHCGALAKGHCYDELGATIQINILCFSLFSAPEWYSQFKVLECSRHELFSDNLDIRVFETTKLPKEIDSHDKMQLWLKLFAATTNEDLDVLEQLGDDEMAQIAARARELSEDDRIAALDRARKRAEHDAAQRLRDAEKEGEARGVAQRDREIVTAMAASGFDISRIADLLGLTTVEITSLLAKQ